MNRDELDERIETYYVRVRGVVQGVGFRPYVYGLARRHGLVGWVRNTSAGVEIHVEGEPGAVEAFVAALPREAPPRSHIVSCERREAAPEGAREFRIVESAAREGAYQLVSPDIATCDDCRRELLDPSDRRYRYPFTNCTNCGPRFTIIEDLPYDRERTTMRRFPLCPDCRREYEDPGDRRFHAEPNACPVCGPRVSLFVGDGIDGEALAAALAEAGLGQAAAREDAAAGRPLPAMPAGLRLATAASAGDPSGPVRVAAGLLRRGAILAVKGLGGFHLACDATDGGVVRRLKARKGRPHKPLAVMMRDLDEVARHCQVTAEEAELLRSPEHPIVLLPWRDVDPGGRVGAEAGGGGEGEPAAAAGAVAGEVALDVALGQRYLGVMLPYTPLHILLLEAAGRPLVMTSGNLAEEPIVKDVDEVDRLLPVADAFLVHDRGIAVRYDDSVAQVRRGRPRLVRRSRGYAPFPVALPRPLPQVLACGAELKNTFCMTRDAHAFLSQHIGDLENLETLAHFEHSIAVFRHLFHLVPEAVAYDLHPDYLATRHALRTGLPAVAVQHHHAHAAARMVEHGREAPVVAVSLDGLGYGHDGGLWGGEVLVCDLTAYRRVAHLEPLPLPGGDAAVRQPWRTALGWCAALLGDEGARRALALLRRPGERAAADAGAPEDDLAGPGEDEAAAVLAQVRGAVNAPPTSSCGRLFDAVAALAGVRQRITYEGQAAVELEMRSVAGEAPYPYGLDGEAGEAATGRRLGAAAWQALPADAAAHGPPPAVVRLAPLLSAVLDDLERGLPAGVVGGRLHATLAALVRDLCRRVRAATELDVVALSGGVFQNRLLADLCETGLEEDGFTVLSGGLVPANDGGLALGQAAVAGYTLLAERGEWPPPGHDAP